MKNLILIRTQPGPTPITSFLGKVAEAVVFNDGTSVLKWRTIPSGIEIYPTEESMRLVRESSGRSHFIDAGG